MNIEDFDEFRPKRTKLDSDDDEPLNEEIVERLHFGGGQQEKEEGDDFFKVKKTKEEVFKEIVTKSKIFKAARAEERDQNEELIDELDKEFGDIFDLLETRAKVIREDRHKEPQGMSLLEVAKKQGQKEINKKSEMRRRDQKSQVKKGAMNTDYNYDALQHELKNSARARPNLLYKSEMDKALDRKDELERLEQTIKKHDEIAEELNEEDDSASDNYQDPEQMNNALVDLIDNEYASDEADEFEAIEESDDDDE